MDAIQVTIFSALIFVYVGCQELGLLENKPGICYKVHTANEPRLFPNPRKPLYPNLHEACTEWLTDKDHSNCLGLKTQNNEILILSCKGVSNRRRPGCYKIVNRDKREEIVCQKVNKNEGCEIIVTRTNLTVVVNCVPRGYSPSIFDIKTRKPPREYRSSDD